MLRRLVAPFVLAGLAASACSSDFDTTRKVEEEYGTVGQQLYALLCDRVGASSLAEDVEGASYRRVCHLDPARGWADTVDTSLLPPSTSEARRLGVAKVEAMARRRADLVAAFDTTFPDVEVADPRREGGKVRLHDALVEMLHALVPLYESNPLSSDPAAQPVLPQSTRALARFLDALATSPEARAALAKLGGRGGYRPLRAALGALRPVLAYPKLRSLVQASIGLVGPGGGGEPELQNVLEVVERELASLVADPPLAPFALADASAAQPNRPRTNYEFLQNVLLTEHAAFADPSGAPRWIASRDRRGFVLPSGTAGVVAAPFTDGDGDGLADVDALGRFLGADGDPLAIDPPFVVPGAPRVRAPDVSGRALDASGSLLFRYLDTSRTATARLGRDLVPLVDADPSAQHETLMYTLSGLQPLLGDRAALTKTSPYELSYIGFDPAKSPIADLMHALGQVLADPGSDDILQSLADLAETHEPVFARMLGDALATYADATDASQPLKAAAHLDRASTLWDEMADWLAAVAKVPGDSSHPRSLLEDLLVATADDGVLKLASSMGQRVQFKDRLSYDPDDLNGAPKNLDSKDKQPLHVPVDRTSPPSDGANNRSAMQRLAQLIHDTNGLKTCNKAGGKVYARLFGIEIPGGWPTFSSYKECELFHIDDMAVFYLESILPADHPRRSKMPILDTTLNAIMGALGAVGQSPDKLLADSSGIAGFTLHPSPQALNRFVYFGSTSDQFGSPPDVDPYVGSKNKLTNTFVSGMIEPLPTAVCPLTGSNGTRKCATFDDTARGRDAGYLFLGEDADFLDGLRPLVKAFADHGQTHLLVEFFDLMHRHWASPAHGPECQKSGDAKSNPRFCSEDGVVAYEPILATAFASDMPAAVNQLAKALLAQQVTTARGPLAGRVRDGVAVAADLTTLLFDPARSASTGVVDRHGSAKATWSDGTPKAQTTPFDLFANALVAMDDRLASSSDYPDIAQRKTEWKRSRSQLVDQFLRVDGQGDASAFQNPLLPKTLPILLRTVREQLNANCPDRENPGGGCAWARTELGAKAEEGIRSPLTGSLLALAEKIRGDEGARRAVERLLSYLLTEGSDPATVQATLASLHDLIQVLQDDGNLSPILVAASNAAAPSSGPDADPARPGLAATVIQALRVLTDASDRYDPYRAMDSVLANLVRPIDPDAKDSFTPLDVFLDTIAEVQRVDASEGEAALTAEDWEAVTAGVRDFLASPTRGMEQFYTVVQRRNEP